MILTRALMRTKRKMSRIRTSRGIFYSKIRRAVVRSAGPKPYGWVTDVKGAYEVYPTRAIAAQTRWLDRTKRITKEKDNEDCYICKKNRR